jgi:hypothetical protein
LRGDQAKTAPLIVEAESAYRDLDKTSANGIAYVRDNLCFPIAAGSFEEGMGAWSTRGSLAFATPREWKLPALPWPFIYYFCKDFPLQE